MANIDAPSGLIPRRSFVGGAEVQTRPYYIQSGLAANIGLYSPVKPTGTAKRVTLGVPGDTLVGSFAGVTYTDTTGTVVYSKNWVSGTATLNSVDAIALVYDDPQTLFEVQASAAFTSGDIGLNADLTSDVPTGGVSRAEVDSTTFTTAIAQVKILDVIRDDSNEITANAKLLVQINEHAYRGATAGI